MDEIVVRHLGCFPWSNASDWTSYLRAIENILGSKVTHLDTDDPVGRRVTRRPRSELGEYITAFGEHDGSRWVFGKLDAIGVELTIQHYKKVTDFPNSMAWYFSKQFLDRAEACDTIADVFDVGNERLSTFYGFADWDGVIARKKKKDGSVDIQTELVGIFWLTYFGRRYVELVGPHVFESIAVCDLTPDGCASLRLAESPNDVSDSIRLKCERKLGNERFVDPADLTWKRPGKFALTFEQLRAAD